MNLITDVLQTTNDFDINLAVRLAEASKLAYQSDDDIITKLKMEGFDHVYPFEEDLSRGFSAFDLEKRNALLSFRGTDNFKNLITDLKFIKVNYTWGKVHKGFYLALADAYNELIKFANEVTRLQIQDVYITGHSLGGALAMMTAAEFTVQGKKFPMRLYTYGQPKVGNTEFAQMFDTHFQKLAWRVVNGKDPIPELPPKSFSYQHCGAIKHIIHTAASNFDSSEAIQLVDTQQPLLTNEELEKIIQEWETGKGIPWKAKDHRIDEYMRRVGNDKRMDARS